MNHQFEKHYTLAEAQELLPEVKVWLEKLSKIQNDLTQVEPELVKLMRSGCDVGGGEVDACVRFRLEFTDIIQKFQDNEIQIKDLESGLIDFPAIMEGREVFLCWHKGEDDIEYWHDIETGFAGRQKISSDFF
jgi:hypothetical protein